MNASADLEAATRTGLRWLYETVQPSDAILQHHGESLYVPEANRSLRFVPTGWERHAVIVLDVAHVEWGGYLEPPLNPLASDELASYAALLGRLGQNVCHTWNGAGVTGSIALAQPAHPSLIAAVQRYHDGCPEHPQQSVFCKCGWYTNGNSKVVHLRDMFVGATPAGEA